MIHPIPNELKEKLKCFLFFQILLTVLFGVIGYYRGDENLGYALLGASIGFIILPLFQIIKQKMKEKNN